MSDCNQQSIQALQQEVEALRKQVAVLEDRSLKWQAVIETAPDAVCIVDDQGAILEVNEQFSRMLGYSVGELMQMTVLDIAVHLTPETFAGELASLRDEGSVLLETQHRRKDGGILDVEVSAHFVDQACTQIMAFARDVTVRKQEERELRQTRELMDALFDAITESVLAIDRHGMVVAANATAAQRFGLTVETFVGTSVRTLDTEVVPECIQKQLWARMEKVLASKEPLRFVSERLGLSFDTCFYPLIDETGEVGYVVIYAQEVTELRRQQEILEAFRARMVKAERLASAGTLSAMAAHQLSQPLTVARLSVQNAMASLEENLGTVKSDLQECLGGIDDATEVVKLFRDFARNSPERLRSDFEVFTLVNRVHKLLESNCVRAQMTVQYQQLSEMSEINWYEKELEQLVYILMENAIQAAPGDSPRQLSITGSMENGVFQMAFADTCGGMPQENESRVFEPFFTTKVTHENTGLGLCVVTRILEDLGGRVRMENRPGKGVTFWLSWPLRDIFAG